MNKLLACLVLISSTHLIAQRPIDPKPEPKVEVPVVTGITLEDIRKLIENTKAPEAPRPEVPWADILTTIKEIALAFLAALGGKLWAVQTIRTERGPNRRQVAEANTATALSAANAPVIPVPLASVAPVKPVVNDNVVEMLRTMSEKLDKIEGTTK